MRVLNLILNAFEPTDEQSMWRVRTEDDPQAFARLVRKWQPPIQRLCTRMLGNSHRGEDLAQETFARLYAKRKTIPADAKFSTYLWRMAMNLCYDELRKQRTRRELLLSDQTRESIIALNEFIAPEPAPDVSLANQEQAQRIRDALLQLPEIYRAVLVLRHYENLKFKEIADVLEIAEGTVKSRTVEGLRQLQKILHPTGKKNYDNPRLKLYETPRR